MTDIEYRQVKEAMRQVMKSRKITYADLADQLGAAEVTIKRFFSEAKYSGKLFSICEALNLSLFDLVEMAKSEKRKVFAFTAEQDEFFAEHLGHFAIFRELYRKNSVDSIQKRWELDQNRIFEILMKLEKLGLIEVYENERIKILPEGVMELKQNSKLEIVLREKLTAPFLELFTAEYPSDAFYMNSEVEMSSDTYKLFLGDLNELTNKYCTLALRDKNLLDRPQLKSVRWLFCFSEYRTKWESFRPV